MNKNKLPITNKKDFKFQIYGDDFSGRFKDTFEFFYIGVYPEHYYLKINLRYEGIHLIWKEGDYIL
jgi:hypothetical protein